LRNVRLLNPNGFSYDVNKSCPAVMATKWKSCTLDYSITVYDYFRKLRCARLLDYDYF